MLRGKNKKNQALSEIKLETVQDDHIKMSIKLNFEFDMNKNFNRELFNSLHDTENCKTLQDFLFKITFRDIDVFGLVSGSLVSCNASPEAVAAYEKYQKAYSAVKSKLNTAEKKNEIAELKQRLAELEND